MRIDRILILTLAATAADGLLAGASLDQSIKQLPARHRIGVKAYSAYSQAADLEAGVAWYGVLGVNAPLLTIAAAVMGWRQQISSRQAQLLSVAAGLAIAHSLVTTQAAPTNFSQRRVADNEEALTRVFNRFERWQALRAALQVLNFGVMLWALVASVQAAD